LISDLNNFLQSIITLQRRSFQSPKDLEENPSLKVVKDVLLYMTSNYDMLIELDESALRKKLSDTIILAMLNYNPYLRMLQRSPSYFQRHKNELVSILLNLLRRNSKDFLINLTAFFRIYLTSEPLYRILVSPQ